MTPALAALMAELPEPFPLTRIDRVWVFPPRMLGEVESGLVVLSLRSEGRPDADEREVVTVHYEVRPGKGGPDRLLEVVSRGWAPSERIPRMIDGVVRRLGEDNEEPRTATIEGDGEGWNRFVAEVSDDVVDLSNGE